MDRFRHEALLYDGDAEFLAGTVPFIEQGIEAGEPVLIVESGRKISMLRGALRLGAGEVMFADMSEVGANPARIIPAWRDFVRRHGADGKRLRGIGEPIWNGRTPEELIECQRHESLLNVAFGHGQPWRLLCPYDVRQLPPQVIDEARRSHEWLTAAGTEVSSPDYRGIDACGAPFQAPLSAPPAGSREVPFDTDSLLAMRGVVSRFATASGLSATRTIELVTAVNEVATNSVVHGGGSGLLHIWASDGTLKCDVRDPGNYVAPLADRERPGEDSRDPRGLWLANQVCDLVQIRSIDGGTVVRLHVKAAG
jgi:anti-sigma regulatory factor (Ser/Thr protein kinase)